MCVLLVPVMPRDPLAADRIAHPPISLCHAAIAQPPRPTSVRSVVVDEDEELEQLKASMAL